MVNNNFHLGWVKLCITDACDFAWAGSTLVAAVPTWGAAMWVRKYEARRWAVTHIGEIPGLDK